MDGLSEGLFLSKAQYSHLGRKSRNWITVKTMIMTNITREIADAAPISVRKMPSL
jgi:hypothetical protein